MFRLLSIDSSSCCSCHCAAVHRATEVGGGTGKGGCHVEGREYPGALSDSVPDPEYVGEFNNHQAHKNKDAI